MEWSHDAAEVVAPGNFDRYRHREGAPASAGASASASAPTSGGANSPATVSVTSDSLSHSHSHSHSPAAQIVSDIPSHPRLPPGHAAASKLAKTAGRKTSPAGSRGGFTLGGSNRSTHSHSPAPIAPGTKMPPSRLGSGSAPATALQQQPTSSDVGPSFPSPGREQGKQDLQFADECARITSAIRQAQPEAVRFSIRDDWEKTLLGSAFHQAFVLNASVHHISQDAVQRSIRDFGAPLVAKAKHQIVDIMSPADLDKLADRILAKATNNFLDKAVDKRLKTMESQRLVNALARSERLGYDLDDITDNKNLPPDEHSTFAPAPAAVPRQSSPAPQGEHYSIASPFVTPDSAGAHYPNPCGVCLRRFTHRAAFEYHVTHKVCTRSPGSPDGLKFSCQHCGQGFTSVVQLQQHNANNVCGVPVGSRPSPTTPAPGKKSQKAVSTTGPRQGTPLQSTPLQGTTGPTNTHGADTDPYANLSPEQLTALQAEFAETEAKYGELLRQASNLPAPERNIRITNYCNSYSTRQSNIRKKYGIRLRSSRKKGEVMAERSRVQYMTASELMAANGLSAHGSGSGNVGRPVATASTESTHGARASASASRPSPNQKPRTAMQPQPQPAPTTLASSLPAPQPEIQLPGSVSMHKRPYDGQGNPSPNHKRTANYADMGGLGGANADAEMIDPTGTADQPVTLESSEDDQDDDEDDDSRSNEDIPARLPVSVAQSLQSSSASQGSSRPVSRST